MCRFDRVGLHWDGAYATSYQIQIAATADAPDGWQEIYGTTNGRGRYEGIPLPPTQARYVRLSMTTSATADGYALNEFEVFGPPSPPAAPRPAPVQSPDGTLPLTGGQWKLQSASFVSATPRTDFKDWL